MNEGYEALIRWSRRVSSETRRVLLERAQPDDAQYTPRAMNAAAFATLRAVVERVLPQAHSVSIDLAARIDRQLVSGVGDGWRHARLPPDAQAYREALYTLGVWALAEFGRPYSDLPPGTQDNFHERMAAEPTLPVSGRSALDAQFAPKLDADQMKAWFEDLRADAVRLYMAHPETLGRVGYSGIANGGDGEPKSGFVQVGVDEQETWEPLAVSDSPP